MGRKAYERFVCDCGEGCVMVPHVQSGKLAPITIATYPDGNIEVDLLSVNGGHGTYRVVPERERLANPKPRLLNHFTNCPLREQFGGRTK